MRISRHRLLLHALWLLACLLSGCEHKDLCFDHMNHATKYETRIDASYELIWEMPESDGYDWKTLWPEDFGISYSSLNPQMPIGLCVNSYGSDGRKSEKHLPVDGGIVEMSPGQNSLLMYNDDTEFIVIDNLNNSISAKATTRSRSRASYNGNMYNVQATGSREYTVSPPDPLFCHYIETYDQQPLVKPETLSVLLRPLVFTYYVRFEFSHGIEYVGLARGAMAGMAASVYMFDGHTGSDKATILYDDCTVYDWGVEAKVNSFGIPDYPNQSYNRSGEFYGLTLELLLKNGKRLTFDFDVSHIVASQPHGGVIVLDGIEVNDETGSESGSGFDVDVEGWGEYEDVIIDL